MKKSDFKKEIKKVLEKYYPYNGNHEEASEEMSNIINLKDIDENSCPCGYELCEGIIECEHEPDGNIYTSNPPKNKCKKCGEFYR